MDAGRKLTEHQADRALRGLFMAHGRLTCPVGVEKRVLAQSKSTTITIPIVPPLIPARAWAVLASLLGILLTIVMIGPSRTSVPNTEFLIPMHQITGMLTSPWPLLGAVCMGAFLTLHAYLAHRRMVNG